MYTRSLGYVTLCLVCAWIAMLFPLPTSLFSGVFGIMGMVFLIRMLIAGLRTPRRAVAVLTTLFGVPACLLLIGGSALSLLFYGPISSAEECRSQALTHEAVASCTQQTQNDITSWISGLSGR